MNPARPEHRRAPRIAGGWWRPIALAAILLSACAKPVPTERAAWIGHWKGADFDLRIEAGGQVHYRRVRSGRTTTVDAPLQGFDGNDFRVGVGSFATTFVVDTPPRYVDGRWTMTVDGVELRRVD